MRRYPALVVMALVLVVAASPMIAAAADSADGESDSLELVGIFHIGTSRPFPAVIANGIEQAAQDLAQYGVNVQFQGPEEFDIVATAQIIDAAIARQPDGIFMTLPDFDALGPRVQAAADAGIPVITYNSGATTFSETPALVHLGQDEYSAGLAAGRRLVELGATNAICLNPNVGNVSTDDRCRAIADVLSENGGQSNEVGGGGSLGDPAELKGALEAALINDPSIDAVAGGFGGGIEVDLVPEVLAELGRSDDVVVGFFDISTAGINRIKSGDIDFLTSQQPYLQGYMAVWLLTMFHEYGMLPGGNARLIETGPIFITPDNVERYSELVDNGQF